MDDLVQAAMAKWPRVPACYGWLALGARGDWYLRDDATQAMGPFQQGGRARGAVLRHDKLLAFIGRNYEADDSGCWFFQNGPQRVYVELEATPLIWRVEPDFTLVDHTGRPGRVLACETDEQGWLYVQGERGIGLVHTLDTERAVQALEQQVWPAPQAVQRATLAARYGFVPSPQAARQAN